MLLRSSSTRLLNSRNIIQHYSEPSAILNIKNMPRSIKLKNKPSTGYNNNNNNNCMAAMHGLFSTIEVDNDEVELNNNGLLLLSHSGLKLEEEEGYELVGVDKERLNTEVLMMGGGGGSGGGRICCGGGGDDNDSEYGDSNHRHGGIELYYEKMIKANPENPLLLSNYARYLKEVGADFEKAEKYCGRAVMATPDDGNILSLYAELVWKTNKDSILAENYFDQAVQAAPEDCYVLASYAHFLWEAEEEEDKEEIIDAAYGSQSTPAIIAAS